MDQALNKNFLGFQQKTIAIVGEGIDPRELRHAYLKAIPGILSRSILSAENFSIDLAEKLLGFKKTSFLGPLARREILKKLISSPKTALLFPLIKKKKSRVRMIHRIDRAMQAGRMEAGDRKELWVQHAILKNKLRPSALREELIKLSMGYEAILEAQGWMDLPLLLEKLIQTMEASSQTFPWQEVRIFSTLAWSHRYQQFWEALSKNCDVTFEKFHEPSDFVAKDLIISKDHTWEDAAERLIEILGNPDLEKYTIVLGGDFEARRVLQRVCQDARVTVARVPKSFRLKQVPFIQRAMLPLHVVASRFKKEKVLEYISLFFPPTVHRKIWLEECEARGIRQGLNSYKGGKLSELFLHFEKLQKQFASFSSLEDLKKKHVTFMQETLGDWIEDPISTEWDRFLQVWEEVGGQVKTLSADTSFKRIHLHTLIEWIIEKAGNSVSEKKGKFSSSLSIFELDEFTARLEKTPLCFWGLGVPDFQGVISDYWYSSADRELLSSEFDVRTSKKIRDEAESHFFRWLEQSTTSEILEPVYSFQGKERDSLVRWLNAKDLSFVVTDRAAASSRLHSFQIPFQDGPGSVILDSSDFFNADYSVSAGFLDRMSHCAFQALVSHRWKLKDLRISSFDLWPEVRGILLHKAVEILLLKHERGENIVCADILNEAWAFVRPQGFLNTQKNQERILKKLTKILEIFYTTEIEYRERSGVKLFQVENPENLEWAVPFKNTSIKIVGRPDRIDLHPDGLFIIDYKTSRIVPSGQDMVNEGYGLQLPFYAIAARKKYKKEVLGVQFVQFDASSTRSRGIFFKKWNGKQFGALTNTRARLSVFNQEAQEIWTEIEKHFQDKILQLSQGNFSPQPKKQQECQICLSYDVCGRGRVLTGLATEEVLP